MTAAPKLGIDDPAPIEAVLREELVRRGLDTLSAPSGGASPQAIAFFREHDIGFRIRRLRLLARRLARDWEADPDISDAALEQGRDAVYRILALYFEKEGAAALGPGFEPLAENVLRDPGTLLDMIEAQRLLPELDERAEEMLAEALETMPKNLKRRMLLTYLGFPYYDVATLPLLRNESLTEFDPVKVDRISPTISARSSAVPIARTTTCGGGCTVPSAWSIWYVRRSTGRFRSRHAATSSAKRSTPFSTRSSAPNAATSA